jgi:hypothetical protein
LSKVKVRKNIGVGNGKQEASKNAQINNARAPHFVAAQFILHTCIALNQFFIRNFL